MAKNLKSEEVISMISKKISLKKELRTAKKESDDNEIDKITKKRISNAKLLDNLLSSVKQITLPKRKKYLKEVFHLYQINVIDRDK
mgnify:CR=1 FL=1